MTLTPQQIEAHATRALQETLAGRMPAPEDLAPLTGELKECITALVSALEREGVQAVRKAFMALSHDRPWLGKLAAQAPPEAGQEPPERRIRFVPTSEILKRPRQQWLIPGILPRDGVCLLYGEPGSYKSFLVMDWSMCIATGTAWLGRSIARGPVAYIAAEGSYGIGKRVLAWLGYHQRYFQDDHDLDTMLPVRWFDQSLVLQEPSHLAELTTSLQEDFPDAPLLVVIDTLSRCSAGAEEDSNTEMAKFLASADLIREQLHCAVLVVHHEGKDKQRGPRGASALAGNVETLIYVTPITGGSKVTCTKAKDAPPFDPMHLYIQEVQYGLLPDDRSLVLAAGDAPDEPADPPMTQAQATMYELLVKAAQPLAYSDWLDAGIKARLTRRLAGEAIKGLREANRVQQLYERGPYAPAASPTSEERPVQRDGEDL